MGSSSIRSSVETARDSLSDKIAYLTEFLGGEYERQGVYPAWEYRRIHRFVIRWWKSI